MKILGIIPARYASTRFPGKPLAMIGGKTMIEHVYSQASKASGLNAVVVATDDDRIFNEVIRFGGKVVMTSPSHNTGTERCLEALEKFQLQMDAVVNIQGDEPLIAPEQIEQVVAILAKGAAIATLVKKINDNFELVNPNVVKVVMSNNRKALYFSRQPIPFLRNFENDQWLQQHAFFKHIGIYGYSADALRKVCSLQVAALEKAESLEQLRWLENGLDIVLDITQLESIGVDSPDDLKKIANLF